VAEGRAVLGCADFGGRPRRVPDCVKRLIEVSTGPARAVDAGRPVKNGSER